MSRQRSYQRGRRPRTSLPIIALSAAILGVLLVCGVCWAGYQALQGGLTDVVPPPNEVVLRVAYSPEKDVLFRDLVDSFNRRGEKTPAGLTIRVEAVQLEPEEMLERALADEFQAITPDSSLWLDQLDRRYAERSGPDATLVGPVTRYAVSPVVLIMWRDVAEQMGYPTRPIGWGDVLARAQSDPDFKWSHPSTASASGILATLAAFYAGAGKTRGLTEEDVNNQQVLDYVGALEKTVRYYGEGEWATAQRVKQEGRGVLDAFVGQEQIVIWLRQQGVDVVAVYPVEGSLWEDHPLALLETPGLSDDQRTAFERFSDYLTSEEAQMKVLANGYRPADLSIPLDSPGSPLQPANGVDPNQPQTALQIPPPAVVQVVQNAWWETKRRANIILVVDTSGSMAGEKIANVREALRLFIDQVKSDRDSIGLITFNSQVYEDVPLDRLENNRARLLSTVEAISARGNTALLDAVYRAYTLLQRANDHERINAIVVMTDGMENASAITLTRLTAQIRDGNRKGVPVLVFAIAYGEDADKDVLQHLAEASGGQMREGTLETIRDLYRILSTYF